MKKLALVAMLVLLGVATVDVLGDATQSRPDRVPRNSQSEIVLDVRADGYRHSLEEGANHLWGACAGSTRSELVDPGIVEVQPGRFKFVLEPGLGKLGRRVLVGCLEDLTINHLLGNVVSVQFSLND